MKAKPKCYVCGKKVNLNKYDNDVQKGEAFPICDACYEPDWTRECEVCGSRPIVPATGMCGPCTWGEAETANGNW